MCQIHRNRANRSVPKCFGTSLVETNHPQCEQGTQSLRNSQPCHTGFMDCKEWGSAHGFTRTGVGAHRTTKRHGDALRAFPPRVFCLSSRCCCRRTTGLLRVCVMSGSSREMSQIPQDFSPGIRHFSQVTEPDLPELEVWLSSSCYCSQ